MKSHQLTLKCAINNLIHTGCFCTIVLHILKIPRFNFQFLLLSCRHIILRCQLHTSIYYKLQASRQNENPYIFSINYLVAHA